MKDRSKKRIDVVKTVGAALSKAGHNLHFYDKEVIAGLVDIIGQTLGVHSLTGGAPPPPDYLKWLSARLRSLAGDIDDGAFPGGKPPFQMTIGWDSVENVRADDRVLDDEQEIEIKVDLLGLPPHPPGKVLVRRWKKEEN